jgi:hypothetical protein
MSYNAFIKQETYGTESGNKAMSSSIRECDQHGNRDSSHNCNASHSRSQALLNIGISLASLNQRLGVNMKQILILATMIIGLSLLLANPTTVQVPSQAATIQAGIDMVADGGINPH